MPVALSIVLIMSVSLRLTVLALRLVVPTVAMVIVPLDLLGLSVLASGRVSPGPVLLVRRWRVAVLVLRGLVAMLLVLRRHGGDGAAVALLLGVWLILTRVLGLVIVLLARGMWHHVSEERV